MNSTLDPRSADFVAETALCDRQVQIVWQAQHIVDCEVQMWQ